MSCALCWAAAASDSAASVLVLGRLELALLGGQMGLRHVQGVDGTRDVATRHGAVLTGDRRLLTAGAEQRLQPAVARARHVRRHGLVAEVGGVGADLGAVAGHPGIDLGDLLADLLHLLLGGVVLLRGGVEALLVGGELRGDQCRLSFGARQGIGTGRTGRASQDTGEQCDDSSGHQNGAARPPFLLA